MASDIEELKSRLDIVEVVRQYVPTLKKAGRNYKGLCPFHSEKTPSFMVNPDLQIYKCFGCGEGGDALTMIQKMERLDFKEALVTAAERTGYQLQQQGKRKEQLDIEKRILEANRLACEFWHYILKTHNAGKPGRDYSTKRGIEVREIDKFKIGYAPRGSNLVSFLKKKDFQPQELVRWGLAIERNGEVIDKFRERLMMPIFDLKGRPVGFSGRIIKPSDYAPKYLNSPETLVYHKSSSLLGMFQAKEAARKANYIILEEGNLDLLASHKVGVENIVATGGTAITELQCALMKRFVDTVYFCFDTDQAGRKALLRGLALAEQVGLKHKALDIGDFQDPDELIQKDPKAWEKVVGKPVNTVAYIISLYEKEYDLGNVDGKSDFVDSLVAVLRSLKDKVQAEHFAEQIALKIGVSKDAVLAKIGLGSAGRLPIEQETQEPRESTTRASHREVYFLALLLELEEIGELQIEANIFLDANCRQIFDYLIATPQNKRDFSKLSDDLDPEGKQLLQEVLTLDLSNVIDNLEDEVISIYDNLYASYLRRSILELRALLQTGTTSDETMSKLARLTQELREISG